MESPAKFIERFEAVVRNDPERTAVSYRGEPALTYSQLRERARVQAAMLRERNIGAECTVAIALEKSPAYVASLLGVWYAGAAFVSIDPELPGFRARELLARSYARVAIGSEDQAKRLSGLDVPFVVPVSAADPAAEFAYERGESDDLAYIIFTTGVATSPKGVLVTHRGIVSMLDAQVDAFSLDRTSRLLFYMPLSSNASVSNIGATLLAGGELVIEPRQKIASAADLLPLLESRRISHIYAPAELLASINPDEVPDVVQVVIFEGELAPHLVRAWAGRVRLIRVYGPTEATVCTSLVECGTDWDRSLIGNPIPGVTYFILDEELKETKVGQAGELFIGGMGLARGYLRRPDLTTRRFIMRHGERLYKTGDKVVRHSDGAIEVLGRIGPQLRLRGHLVEPGEIESALEDHQDVERAVAVRRRLSSAVERIALVAFVVPHKRGSLGSNELREHLARSVPRWMMPQRFEFVDSLPEIEPGVVDIETLRVVPLSSRHSLGRLADSRDADILQESFKQALGIDKLGLRDDFFDLGGNELSVLDVVLAAEARGLVIPPPLMMTHSSIEELLLAMKEMAADRDCELVLSGALDCDYLRSDVAPDKELSSWVEGVAGRTPGEMRQVLVTGAAGVLGCRLLLEILHSTEAACHALVKAPDAATGLARIEGALSLQGVSLMPEQKRRLKVVAGDLAEHRLGLPEPEWRELANAVDTVYHAAGETSLLLPYEALRPSNVVGVWELVRLICEGAPKSLHNVSSLAVFSAADPPRAVLMETDELSLVRTVWGGWAQSKWAVEMLLRQLQHQLPAISHYRLSTLVGARTASGVNASNLFRLFLEGVGAVGCLPRTSVPLRINLLPVDYAARAIVEISRRSQQAGEYGTYHIAHPNCVTLDDISRAFLRAGMELAEVEAAEFSLKASERATGTSDAARATAALSLCRTLPGSLTYQRLRTVDLFQASEMNVLADSARLYLDSARICPPPPEELLESVLRQILPEPVHTG